VQDNKRVAALITVICLALLLFCLIERQVRRALGSEQKMQGLYPGNQKVRPTGRMILYHLSDLRLRVGSATDPPVIAMHPGHPAPPARPPRPGTHTSPLARDLNELPAKYGTSQCRKPMMCASRL
jgi:hypothetical protein